MFQSININNKELTEQDEYCFMEIWVKVSDPCRNVRTMFSDVDEYWNEKIRLMIE